MGAGSESERLREERETLRARLVAVEEAAAEALGELEDAQERLAAERASRQAAEQQVDVYTAS